MEKVSWERKGKLAELDRSFDLKFWQAQTATERFQAAWELMQHAWSVKGHDVRQLQLQRSVETFQRQQRKYLIIGGYAVIQFAEPRYTNDLDIWISADKDNAAAVYKALKEFGASLAGLTEADFAEEGYFYQMGRPPMRVDILMGIPGLDFEKAWQHRMEVDFDSLVVKFISRGDLIETKKASGRLQDLIDADLLSQEPDIEE